MQAENIRFSACFLYAKSHGIMQLEVNDMTQQERRIYLINELLNEAGKTKKMRNSFSEADEKRLLRSLMNVRKPAPIHEEFLRIQDDYLREEIVKKGIVDLKDLQPEEKDIYIWQGDITLLKCGAIVNAANSGMTGCYIPAHACIDNCIHTFAGVQLRQFCHEMMVKQGHEEPTGQAKITPAFNLPCEYVIHTVGPIVYGVLTEENRQMLRSCYESCLKIADENQVESIAFCCISTGEFHFPNEEAAKIAVDTVRDYKERTGSEIKAVFNVFKDYDLEIYRSLLG